MIDEIYEKIIYMKKYMKYMKKSEVIKSLYFSYTGNYRLYQG